MAMRQTCYMSQEWQDMKREVRWTYRALLIPLALMWAIQIVNTLTGSRLNAFGVHPRTLQGLVGILFAPLLHAGFAHLIANTVPWLAAGGLIVMTSVSEFAGVTAVTWITSGLGAWLLGADNSVHIGASGIVFGFFGYLLVRGWLRRSFLGIVVSLALGSTYGMVLLLGAMPGQTGISWQCHAFGLVGGILAAWKIGREKATRALPAEGGARRGAIAPR
jgi:membrane associated rhomboid family serine protease